MRISGLNNSNAMLAQLGVNGNRVAKLMEQLSTQKRVNVPSDDPVAASRLVQLSREQSAIKQYQSNITSLSGALSVQESHITAMSNQVLAVSDKLKLANNSTLSQKDLASYGAELESMLDSLVATMNSKNENGSYLFSGTMTGTKAVELVDGQYVFGGNDQSRETLVANGVAITENTHVAQAFSGAGDDLKMLNMLKELSQNMQDPNMNYADYQDDISAMIGMTQTTSDSLGALFTDLGGRQNRLTLIGDAHTDVSLSNAQVETDLNAADSATTTINLQLYMTSMQITNKAYSMVSQLNLFSML
ncbi:MULTISPECIES: flagellar hook-associated protein FlgL [Enterobacteriaceae]|uniref:Flagellar hook-associated protein 3 n=1 Tax=Kluyvera genomosp. 2 TaxID=2774054 RepID=A0A2T2Y578_9ENTR|nr:MULTISPECIES: flagellar hook-associated protein FlgL [Enterobacteriaceae]HAT3916966.1 flagellar hook-associated protein 3 [Kluyvera ascorbata]PSR47692.1 flagellar hook-associated protein 3 [Kluyvera genomosp. 2]BBQ81587.1 flagellar hook-associated protein 3 [Klebsiella sp. WP3-W18-ESBL-02]BBR18636.1 flagellar hook-associated protein 3 [Klebsiella sp. WP3-S18-ESBL-05]BBR56753.1 flagellar hook-associated protein 3 [Klebsiella sp. WP4-W18-ESBL-05]